MQPDHATQPTVKPRSRATGLFAGLAVLDVVQLVDHVPSADQKIKARDSYVAAGGPATNAAIAFQALGAHSTRLLTRLYPDAAGSIIRADLSDHGIDAQSAEVCEGGATTVASIAVTAPTGQRSVISSTDQRHDKPATELAALCPNLDAFNVLHVDGYELDVALPLAERAQSAGVPVVMDGGSFKDTSPQLLAHVDVAAVSANFHPPGTSSAPEVLEYLLERGPTIAAVTNGAHPIQYATSSGIRGSVTPPQVRTVDTLGAGDFFHGALSFHIACCGIPTDEPSIDAAMRFASRVAARSVQSFGSRAWLTSLRSKPIEAGVAAP